MAGNKILVGKHSEDLACQYLTKNGLTLICRNFRYFTGEIDIIMQEKNTIIFVEVRTRNQQKFGTAIESINKIKQSKIIKTATYFLQKNKLFNKVYCRFDVIGLQNNQIHWIKNAFSQSN